MNQLPKVQSCYFYNEGGISQKGFDQTLYIDYDLTHILHSDHSSKESKFLNQIY